MTENRYYFQYVLFSRVLKQNILILTDHRFTQEGRKEDSPIKWDPFS